MRSRHRWFAAILTLALAPVSAAEEDPRLSWAPPDLVEPIVIQVTQERRSLKLDHTKDYRIQMPDTPLRAAGGLTIFGGRNVVLIGGAIEVPSAADAPEPQQRRGLYLKDIAGTVHIEGLQIGGADLAEGINIDVRRDGAVVQLQNLRIETVHGSFKSNHADVVQTWGGPSILRIDKLTGHTGYQGLFLCPDDVPHEFVPTLFDIRRVNLIGNADSAYLLWRGKADTRGGKLDWGWHVEDVWAQPRDKAVGQRDMFLWPKPSKGDQSWAVVQEGVPPGGDFVPAGVAGVAYVTPGYQPAE
jgi:hypothetical protein